jgi:hypothetical protein
VLRAFTALLALTVMAVVVGCSPASESSTTTTAALGGSVSPEAALRTLLSAVDAGDVEEASVVTFRDQVALLIALDGAPLHQAAEFIEDGVPEQSQKMFWESFRSTYAASFGESLSDMLVAEGGRATVDGVEFSLVEVALRKISGHSNWVARRDQEGRWRVDLFATFASTFAQPMRLWLATLADTLEVAVVRRAIAAQRPSLLAALQQQPLGPISPGIAQQIRGLLADVGATG